MIGPLPRWALPSFLVALLLCGLIVVLDRNLDWEAKKQHIAPTGEAAQNDLLALQMLAQKAGYAVRATRKATHLADLPLDTTVVLAGEVPENQVGRVEPQLVDWVKRGGHLVLIVPGIDQSNQFTRAVGLTRVGEHTSAKHETYQVENRSLALAFTRCDVFRLQTAPIWSVQAGAYKPYAKEKKEDEDADDEDGGEVLTRPEEKAVPVAAGAGDFAAARWPLGKGFVSATCDITPLYNAQLGDKNHAEFALRVLLEPRHEKLVFADKLDETEPGLMTWLWNNAWSALLGAAVLIVLVLWQAIPRLGAIHPEPPAVRPGLREHLRAMAAYLLREKDYVQLLAALREEVLKQAARHANTPDPDLDEIAQLAGVSQAALHAAVLQTPTDRHEFQRAAETLAQVMDVLRAHRPMSRSSSRSKRS